MTLDQDLVAAALPSYEVGGEIGRGGWGIVLAGQHKTLGRQVAIKQLPRAFGADPAVRSRFVKEAQVLASLDHPHIVPVYDFVEYEGLCLLVMERLGGGTVWSRFTGDGMSTGTSCAVALATCAALQAAHGRGVLHRDIKPENLLFSAGEILKVTDFGIAKVIGGPQTLATRAGDVLGTPAYMAPEQAQAKELTPATDVYAAGMMLYELFSGRLPFDDEGDPLTLLYRHVFEPPLPLLDVAPTVPPAIAGVVMKAVATDPADRYDSAEAFGVALAEAATLAWGPGWLARGDLPVMAAASMVAATERPSGPVAAAPIDLSDPTATPAPPGAPATAATTTTGGAATGGGPPPPSTAPPTPTGPPSTPPSTTAPPNTRVRPSGAFQTRPSSAVAAGEDKPRELVPVHRVLPKLRSPVGLALGAVALVLVSFMLARIGLGEPARAAELERSVQMNGNQLSTDAVIELDLDAPVQLTWPSAPGNAPVARVVFRLSVAGVSVGESSVDAVPAADGTFSATVDLTGSRLAVGGNATANIEMQDASGAVVGHGAYPVASKQSGFLTAPGIGSILLALFVIAYAESLLRSRRRGKKAVTATVGMALIGAVGGVAVVLVMWVTGAAEPVLTTLVACAAVGAAAGLAAVFAAARVATRRRLRRRPAAA